MPQSVCTKHEILQRIDVHTQHCSSRHCHPSKFLKVIASPCLPHILQVKSPRAGAVVEACQFALVYTAHLVGGGDGNSGIVAEPLYFYDGQNSPHG